MLRRGFLSAANKNRPLPNGSGRNFDESVFDVGKQSDLTGALDGHGQLALMSSAGAGGAAKRRSFAVSL